MNTRIRLSVRFACGQIAPLSETPWWAMADALAKVAADADVAEDALIAWCEPIHRPLVEDAEITANTRTLLFF